MKNINLYVFFLGVAFVLNSSLPQVDIAVLLYPVPYFPPRFRKLCLFL